MIKINILNRGPIFNWGKNFGYWFPIKYFKEELKDNGFQIDFYNSINDKFYDSDLIIIDNRFFKYSNFNKVKKKLGLHVQDKFLENINKISKKNPNIIWFDLGDSSGNTSFEILPMVKKYVKKQFYKDKNLYKKTFFRARYYADFYQKKFQLEKDRDFKVYPLLKEYENKLVLGWNIGVGNYFNIIQFNKIQKYRCITKSLINNNLKFLDKYFLGYYKDLIKNQDIFYNFNLRSDDPKKSIHFQRNQVSKILKKNFDLPLKRLNHKSYLERLGRSKVSVGAFGWGEICYREFEAVKMGAAVVFPNVDYLETWPNIYKDNFSYLSYKFDFSDLIEKIELAINDKILRDELVLNSQNICKSVYTEEGLKYFVKFFKKITE